MIAAGSQKRLGIPFEAERRGCRPNGSQANRPTMSNQGPRERIADMKHHFLTGVAVVAALAFSAPVWAQTPNPSCGNSLGTPGPNPRGPGPTPYHSGPNPRGTAPS